MNREQFFQTILPYLGGADNISRQVWKGSKLCVTVKDVGALQLDALEGIDAVAEVELNRGRVTVSAQGLENQEENIMATDNKQIAKNVLEAVGGKDNVTQVTHCMTRLRLNLKDDKIPDDEKVKAINGVLGVARSGGQYQVIIGQNVPKVYDEVCKIGGFAVKSAVEENLDGPKEKLTPKTIGNNIMNYLSGSMATLIPGMIGAAMFKTIQVILGPDMLRLITAESSFYILCDMLYNAFFYFIPVFLGYSAAKRLECSPILGMLVGTMLLVPDFTALIGTDFAFSVYGIPAPVADYGQTVVPVILGVWLLSYIEKFFKKVIPNALSTIFVPFLSLAVITPINFCLLAPLGSRLGSLIGNGLLAFGDFGGFVAVAVVAALWEFLVMTGMHVVMGIFAIGLLMTNGVDNFVLVSGSIATWAAYGMALGAFFRQKNKEEKSTSFGFFISGILGGVTEPVLYGIGMKYKRPLIAMLIGGAVGGLYAGITHVGCYVMGTSNFLSILGLAIGGTANIVNGTIASLLAMGVTAVCTYLFGFTKEDLKE